MRSAPLSIVRRDVDLVSSRLAVADDLVEI
jgi:hypothetical protein